MPREIRQWWINEMRKETDRFNGNEPSVTKDGRQIVRDVPRRTREG